MEVMDTKGPILPRPTDSAADTARIRGVGDGAFSCPTGRGYDLVKLWSKPTQLSLVAERLDRLVVDIGEPHHVEYE